MSEDNGTIHLNFDAFQRMRPRDLHEMEQKLGRSFGSMQNMNVNDLDALQLWALAFLQVRRERPDVTWEEVGDMDITFADPNASLPAPLESVTTPGISDGNESLGSVSPIT